MELLKELGFKTAAMALKQDSIFWMIRLSEQKKSWR